MGLDFGLPKEGGTQVKGLFLTKKVTHSTSNWGNQRFGIGNGSEGKRSFYWGKAFYHSPKKPKSWPDFA